MLKTGEEMNGPLDGIPLLDFICLSHTTPTGNSLSELSLWKRKVYQVYEIYRRETEGMMPYSEH